MSILLDLQAQAHASGNRIYLSWHHPAADDYPGIRIVRRSDRYPVHPEDGDHVVDVENATTFQDPQVLRSETVYYYSLFPYRNTPAEYFIDRRNRTSAMATAPYGFAELMYQSMPAVYQRFDKTLPDPELDLSNMSEANKTRGQLRRFFELCGGQLDYIYSHINASKHIKNPDKTHGNLLQLMSSWVGWKTDTRLEFDAQRMELKNAPATYASLGMLPVMESTVKRINNWESRSKEFVHNIARTNTPERLNLWLSTRDTDWQPGTVFSIDHCFEGGISCTSIAANHHYLFYHTQRNGRWDIWFIEHEPAQGWLPSKKLCHRPIIDKNASSVLHDDVLRVFWNGYSDEEGWRIFYRSLVAGEWSEIQEFVRPNACKMPGAIMVQNSLWLFWSENVDGQWLYRYAQAQATGDASVLDFPVVIDFPDDAGASPQVLADVALAYREDPSDNFYIFWARKTTDGLNSWQVAYRRNTDTNLASGNWSEIHHIALAPGESMREPHIRIQADGNPDIYASANTGDSGWNIWHAHLDNFDVGSTTDTWNNLTEIVTGNYSCRAPYYFQTDDAELLFYRSNQHLEHSSTLYGATQMNDWRYSGTTTVDTRNTNKILLREQFDDFQTYSFDTGVNGKRDNEHWYGRDTVGIYFNAATLDQDEIASKISRLKPVLREFIPVTDRVVFIDDTDVHTEFVYNYAAPSMESANYITSVYSDQLTSNIVDMVLEDGEDFSDDFE